MQLVLKAPAIVAAVCMMTGLSIRPALSVDLTNMDKQARNVTIVTPEGRKSVTVPAGGTLANVCGACTIESGSQKRDASGAQNVTVTGPLLLVSGQP